MELIDKYFPGLTELQRQQFAALYGLYADWNAKINVVSRKDFDQLYLRHVLHSLAIAKVCTFDAGARILDVGCGGGFPSVPLAILFPEAHFTAADSIRKKITVVGGVAAGLGLQNLDPRCVRVETLQERYDYVVSRAVTAMPEFVRWIWAKIGKGQKGSLPNGILYLKGGDLAEELVLLVAVTACAALAGCYYPWLALFLAFGMHLLIHLGQWAAVGRYVPVIATSLPCLACCGRGLCIMINSRAFSLREFVLCGMAGCAVAAVNLWLVHRLAAPPDDA